jgi:RimJ/RimL family protein N-acetyltransferase
MARVRGDVTGQVELRDVAESDLPIFYEHQLDPEANRMAAFVARDRDAFMAHWARILVDDSCIAKTVLVDGQVAGNVGSFDMEGQRLVGYWIGKRHWGKGVATRALSTFLELDTARPLHARVAASNVASIRVLEKCGYILYGRESHADGVEELILELT